MITRNITRRLERLEAYLAPPSDEPALVIHLTGVGDTLNDYRSVRNRDGPTGGDDSGRHVAICRRER